jgi:ribokinase
VVEALALPRAEGVDLTGVTEHSTAHRARLATVDDGETTIVVAAGANDAVTVGAQAARRRPPPTPCSPCCVPDATAAAARPVRGCSCQRRLARPVAPEVLRRTDLVVVNRAEYAEPRAGRRAPWPSRSAATARSCAAAAGGGEGGAAAHHGRRRTGP